MARSQRLRHSSLFGSPPKRSCFVASRLLTSLVFLAALVQVIPVAVVSSRAGVGDADSQASVCESLTANTKAVESWVTQPTGATRLIRSKSNDSEPRQGGWGTFISVWAIPNSLPRGEKHYTVNGYACCLASLVDLNVRLQV